MCKSYGTSEECNVSKSSLTYIYYMTWLPIHHLMLFETSMSDVRDIVLGQFWRNVFKNVHLTHMPGKKITYRLLLFKNNFTKHHWGICICLYCVDLGLQKCKCTVAFSPDSMQYYEFKNYLWWKVRQTDRGVDINITRAQMKVLQKWNNWVNDMHTVLGQKYACFSHTHC